MTRTYGYDIRDGILLVISGDDERVVASGYPEGDGWWRGTDITGRARRLFPRPGADPAEADIAARLARP